MTRKRLPALPALQPVVWDSAEHRAASRLRMASGSWVRYAAAPRPGFWRIRLVKGGPWVPAAIRIVHTTHEPGLPDNLMDRSPFLAAFIHDDPADMELVWESKGEPIDTATYEFMCADHRWAKQHAPHEPIASPRAAVDLNKVAPIF